MGTKSIVIAVAVVLALAGCAGPAAQEASDEDSGESTTDETASDEESSDDDDESSSDTESADSAALTVVLSNTSCVLNTPTYAALEEGYFEEEGLDLTVEAVNGSSPVLQAMLSGQADFGGPGAIPVISAQASDEDVVYFMNAAPGGSFFLVAPEETGISEPADLEGRVIGVATADGNEVGFVDVIMEGAGLADNHEKLTVGEGGQAVAAFERGDIEAYAASADGYATIEEAGLAPVNLTPDDVDYMFGNGFAAPRDLIEEQPEALEAFGRAYHRALQLTEDDPDGAMQACEAHQPQELENAEYAERLLEISMMTRQSPYEDDPQGFMRPEDWEEIMNDAVLADHVEEGEVDVEDVYTNDLVDGMQP